MFNPEREALKLAFELEMAAQNFDCYHFLDREDDGDDAIEQIAQKLLVGVDYWDIAKGELNEWIAETQDQHKEAFIAVRDHLDKFIKKFVDLHANVSKEIAFYEGEPPSCPSCGREMDFSDQDRSGSFDKFTEREEYHCPSCDCSVHIATEFVAVHRHLAVLDDDEQVIIEKQKSFKLA